MSKPFHSPDNRAKKTWQKAVGDAASLSLHSLTMEFLPLPRHSAGCSALLETQTTARAEGNSKSHPAWRIIGFGQLKTAEIAQVFRLWMNSESKLKFDKSCNRLFAPKARHVAALLAALWKASRGPQGLHSLPELQKLRFASPFGTPATPSSPSPCKRDQKTNQRNLKISQQFKTEKVFHCSLQRSYKFHWNPLETLKLASAGQVGHCVPIYLTDNQRQPCVKSESAREFAKGAELSWHVFQCIFFSSGFPSWEIAAKISHWSFAVFIIFPMVSSISHGFLSNFPWF